MPADNNVVFHFIEGVSPTSYDLYQLHLFMFLGCLLMGGLLLAALYYRRASGWAVFGVCGVLILGALTWASVRVSANLKQVDHAALTVKITGYPTRWYYELLENNLSFFNELNQPLHPLVLPIHEKIRFLVSAQEGEHAWWVPDLGVKREASPGVVREAWTYINKPGVYRGETASVFGGGGPAVPILVIAVPRAVYHHWLSRQKTGGGPAPVVSAPVASPPSVVAVSPGDALRAAIARGEVIYNNTCSVCHQPSGEGIPPTFPALKGSQIATGPVDAHLNRVLNGKPGTAMRAFRDILSDQDIADVITYERNAFGNQSNTQVTVGEVIAARAKPPQ